MSDRLLRVTAAAGRRRSDLAVPGGVALAELVPDLARAVGLLDPAAAYAGYQVQVGGRRLRADQGLREQGVDDGALLAVAAVADSPPPAPYDDLVDATADAVRQQRGWQPADTRRTTLTAGLAASALGLALGVGVVAAGAAPRVPGAGWDPGLVAAVALVLVVLAGNALPALAVAAGVARADGTSVDPGLVGAMVRRSGRVLVAGSAVVGGLATLLAPLVATDAPGTALVATCCGVLLLRARRHHAFVPALADVTGGLAVLAAAVATVVVRHPDDRSTVAAALVVGGCATCAVSRLPATPTPLRARALDVLETLAVVALAPQLLVATDGLAVVAGS
ncbi:EsaB/YukD family protein [Nocardioides antri]|uniref:EsaB/YukD family protein n=1 Tax=Nocardioides antri TaxID=2607659 RepID=UPI00165EF2DF|nr:EsaB/YukD family protein [Nocardioides antri]